MLATLTALLCLAAPVPTETDEPKGPPPTVTAVTLPPEGAPFITRTVTEYVPEVRVEKFVRGMVEMERRVTVVVPVTVTRQIPLDGKEVQVYSPDGKRLDAKDLRRLVKGTAPALVSSDGKMVDPFYLRLAREGTLVIVLPPEPVPGPKVPQPPLPPQPSLPPERK